ncbi:MAG: tRNA (guanosine(46)-N7)-methyltransferase TrmB, partial [Rhodospirillales bacterium]|nr:tRNA (guanosine(46)-N7)-methyltransferase TrmB [Rhodospirillales bacterium]
MNRGPDGPQFYGRRKTRKLRPGRRRLIEKLLPGLRISLPAEPATSLDPASLFVPDMDEVWLEIGFGGGEHLAWQAKAHPNTGQLGCEPFINGVARLLSRIDQEKLNNIKILDDEAGPLLDALPEASIGRVFILFPDPWP